MLYRKNVPGWERWGRILFGAAIGAAGWLLWHSSLVGRGVIATGMFVALTGFFGWCPMCYVGGRRLGDSA